MIVIPKGTKDVLPQDSYRWQFIEQTWRDIARTYCIEEIRTPTFEHTELFLRGVGDTTDIVNKEMYTFEDKGGRSITLKPEGTAGVARAFIENSLYGAAQPTKMYYITSVFRYEKPQAGRLREHHQFGIEYFGTSSPLADVEVMSVAKSLFERLGINELTLRVNSIGCPECRKRYNAALKEYLASRLDEMCPLCKERFDKNPLRILDCKEEGCKRITKEAPVVLDYLCDACRSHHEAVCAGLDTLGIGYVVDPYIVRGLDYYTRTVFEFVSDHIGAQGTVCGGGRYNGLVEQVGGKPTPAVGFGMGIERLLLTLEKLGLDSGDPHTPDAYIAPICAQAREIALKMSAQLRGCGLAVTSDLMERSMKAQLKYADKIGAKYVILLGEDEIASSQANIKEMKSGVSESVALEQTVQYLKNKLLSYER